MTIETQVSKIRYTGDGAARVFPVPFPVRQAEHLRLYLASALGTEIVLESGYTVQGAGTDKVSVTLSAPLPSGKNLAIVRLVPLTQQMDLENGGNFDAETIERQLDITEMQIQQLQEQLDRTIKAPVTDDADPGKLWKDLREASQAALDAYAAILRIADPATLNSYAANVRRSCLAEADVPSGGLLALPAWYYPGRGILYLAVGGHVCAPRRPETEGHADRLYEEVGDDPNVLSNQVRVWFPVEAGALVDVWVVASNLFKEMDRLEDAAEAAAQSARSAAGVLLDAQSAAELAGEKAQEAAQSAAEAAQTLAAAGGGPDSIPDASPARRGLAPAGGAAGQVYRVNSAGTAYEWGAAEAISLAAPGAAGLVPAGGAAGQVFRVNDAGDAYGWGDAAAGSSGAFMRRVFTSSGTFAAPVSTTYRITVIGGGGGGGGGGANAKGGGGGGQGGTTAMSGVSALGGGGGGGGAHAGGGGGGGLGQEAIFTREYAAGTALPLTVGAGGSGGIGSSNSTNAGTNGAGAGAGYGGAALNGGGGAAGASNGGSYNSSTTGAGGAGAMRSDGYGCGGGGGGGGYGAQGWGGAALAPASYGSQAPSASIGGNGGAGGPGAVIIEWIE